MIRETITFSFKDQEQRRLFHRALNTHCRAECKHDGNFVDLTSEQLDCLIAAVEYKHAVSQQNDPRYFAAMWDPLLHKLQSWRRP